MKRELIFFIFVLALMTTFVSASLGTFKQNECVDIRVLANCTGVNLTEVRGQVINAPMTLLGGQTFNYTFCNTTNLGEYIYSWDNVCIDCSQGDCGNSFIITPNGKDLTTGGGVMFIVFIVGILFIFSLCLYGSIVIPFKNGRGSGGELISVNDMKYLKIFLIIMSYVVLVMFFGLSRSIFANYIYEAGVDTFFTWGFWILFSLMFPIIVVAIIVSFILFIEDLKLKEILKRGLPEVE